MELSEQIWNPFLHKGAFCLIVWLEVSGKGLQKYEKFTSDSKTTDK